MNISSEDKDLETFSIKRINICKECEHYKALICTKCGCFMPLKVKLRQVHCPIHKWNKEL